MKVLFYSTALVSPATGAGQTVFNLLESEKEHQTVYYAFPDYREGRFAWAELYENIGTRTQAISLEYPREAFIKLLRERGPNWLNIVLSKYHNANIERHIAAQLQKRINKLSIDVLLVYLATKRDIKATHRLLKNCRTPIVIWVMDDHDYDDKLAAQLGEIWNRVAERFVISERMQKDFSERYGRRSSHVFNNSHPFNQPFRQKELNAPLRIGYAGSTAGYYQQTLDYVFNELSGLYGEFELDIYSHYRKYKPEIGAEIPCRLLGYLPPDQLLERLKEYDILLLLSSFEEKYRSLMERSLASKLADYLYAGRCILAIGPTYAENIRYVQKYDFAEAITSLQPGKLREELLLLKRFSETLQKRARDAYVFGQKMHNSLVNQEKIWQILSNLS